MFSSPVVTGEGDREAVEGAGAVTLKTKRPAPDRLKPALYTQYTDNITAAVLPRVAPVRPLAPVLRTAVPQLARPVQPVSLQAAEQR